LRNRRADRVSGWIERMKQFLVSLVSVVTLASSSFALAGDSRCDEASAVLAQTLGDAPAPTGRAPARALAQKLRDVTASVRQQLLDGASTSASPASSAASALSSSSPLPDVELRCALGVLHAHAGELARAQLHLAACDQPSVCEALRERGGRAQAAVARALRASALSPLDIDAKPSGWLATVEEFPESLVVTPHTLWLPAGLHRLRFAASAAALAANGPGVIARPITTERHARAAVFVEAPVVARKEPGTGVVSFEEDVVREPPQTTRPAPEKHRSLLPARYRRGLTATAAVEEVDDRGRTALAIQLGAGRLTGDLPSVTASRLAAHGRVGFTARWSVELGVDWTHRFDEAGAMPDDADDRADDRLGADAFGALLGARLLLWEPARLSALAALRGRLESADSARAGATLQLEARPLPRWPLALGAAFELEEGGRSYSAFAAVELWSR
jgi:hypothetical protein